MWSCGQRPTDGLCRGSSLEFGGLKLTFTDTGAARRLQWLWWLVKGSYLDTSRALVARTVAPTGRHQSHPPIKARDRILVYFPAQQQSMHPYSTALSFWTLSYLRQIILQLIFSRSEAWSTSVYLSRNPFYYCAALFYHVARHRLVERPQAPRGMNCLRLAASAARLTGNAADPWRPEPKHRNTRARIDHEAQRQRPRAGSIRI